MPDAERDVKIKVDVDADTAKAKQVENVIGEIKDSIIEQTSAQKELNKEASTGEQVLDALGSRTGAAKDVIEGLSRATRGGTGAFFGLAKAAKNFMEVISLTNPVARIISLIAALAGGVYVLTKRFGDAKVTIDETDDALKNLDERKLENTKQAIAEVVEKLKSSSTEAERLRDRLASLEDAKLAQKLAEIDLAVASGEMSKEDAAFLKASNIFDAEQAKIGIEEFTLRSERSRLSRSSIAAAGNLSDAEARFAEAKKERNELAAGASGMSADEAEKTLSVLKTRLSQIMINVGGGDTHPAVANLRTEIAQTEKRLLAARQLPFAESRLSGASSALERSRGVIQAFSGQADRVSEIDARLGLLGLQRGTLRTRFDVADAERTKYFAGQATEERAGNEDARAKGRELVGKAYEVARDTTKTDEEVDALLDELMSTLRGIGRRFAGSDAKLAELRKELDTLNSQNKYGGTR